MILSLKNPRQGNILMGSSLFGLTLTYLMLSFAAADSPIPLGIPVGMFNVYASSDGNLGRSEPDLLEVFSGTPDLPYECINIVQHYWPSQDSLPKVEGDRYVEWWRRYIKEAYDLTNQDGEVRLRVLVGPLYAPFLQRGGGWLANFIEELCAFERGSPLEGSIAGWYVAEEPMGGSHNYDPDLLNRMIGIIKEAEDKAGSSHHQIYITVAVEGRYYTPQRLVEFCRNVDVVMLSSSTYLWFEPKPRPIYSPNWWAIHWSMSQVRNTLRPYFQSEGRKLPKIHVILQAYDVMGYGQPTHWEMRQQINYALNYGRVFSGRSLIANDPPADGIWFFWWTGIAKKEKDDWTYGKRIAEAIESTVASVRSPSLPSQTKLLLNEKTPFNPTDSPIPYQLARRGNVRVEVLDATRSAIASFDMGFQVEGVLSPFGGPIWNPESSLSQGRYTFRLYLDDVMADEKTIAVRWKPEVILLSHKTDVWSVDRHLIAEIVPPPLKKGLRGYAYLLDDSPYTVPPTDVNLSKTTEVLEENLEDGIWYLHIRCVDDAGNWSDTFHLGPIMVDSTPPRIEEIQSSIEQGVWSGEGKLTIKLKAKDETSGVGGILYSLDHRPSVTTLEGRMSPKEEISLDLPDGMWFLHLIVQDKAGNRSEVINLGPFLIDTSPPPMPKISSASHEPGRWSNWNLFSASIELGADGIRGVSLSIDGSPEGRPDDEVDLPPGEDILKELRDGIWYLHLKSIDRAGNTSPILNYGPIMIDTSPPTPPIISSATHKEGSWSSSGDAVLNCEAQDEESGVQSLLYLIAPEGERLYWDRALETRSGEIRLKLRDGRWVISAKAIDRAGNESELSSYEIWIDTTPPPPPLISSPTHQEGKWTGRRDLFISWSDDDISGISSYLYLLDSDPDSEPIKSLDGSVNSMRFESLPDGVRYFHLKAINGAGLTSPTAHYEIRIDSSIPPPPTVQADVRGDLISFRWNIDPPPSGIVGYSFLLDPFPHSIPDERVETTDTHRRFQGLGDGIWFFHVRALSGSGVWGETAHTSLLVDRTPPRITISSSEGMSWSKAPITLLSGEVEDNLSGIDPNSFEFRLNNGEWMSFKNDSAQEGVWRDEDEIPPLLDEGVTTVQVKVSDKAGNTGVSAPMGFMFDLTPPTLFLNSPTHPDQDRWYPSPFVRFLIGSEDNLSGVAAYSFLLDRSPETVPPKLDMMRADRHQLDFDLPSDGSWFLHLRARDEAGNWSEPVHYRVNLDSTPPKCGISVLRPKVDLSSGEIAFYTVKGDPPELLFGPARIELSLSEKLSEGPRLLLKKGSDVRELELSPSDSGGLIFSSAIFVDASMDEGQWELVVQGRDKGANPIGGVDGGRVRISSHIEARRGGTIFTKDLSSALLIPKRSFEGRARFELIPVGVGYRLKILDPIRLVRPLKLVLPLGEEIRGGNPAVFFYDGVHAHQIGGEVVGDRIVVSVDGPGLFFVSRALRGPFRAWAAPNPFTSSTLFHVVGGRGKPIIRIFTIKGRPIRTLRGEVLRWDGRDEEGRTVESGLYIFQALDGGRIATGTVVFVK